MFTKVKQKNAFKVVQRHLFHYQYIIKIRNESFGNFWFPYSCFPLVLKKNEIQSGLVRICIEFQETLFLQKLFINQKPNKTNQNHRPKLHYKSNNSFQNKPTRFQTIPNL